MVPTHRMAKSPSNRADTSITVSKNSASGSHDYVVVKEWAAKGDDISRMLSTATEQWFGMLDGFASMTDSVVAATGWGAFVPSAKTAVKESTKAIRSVHSIWSSAQRGISEPEWMRSPEHAQNMIEYGLLRPSDEAVNQHLNGRLFTHNKDGSLNATSASAIRPYFDPKNSDKWPNLILTSSHALVRDHTDISSTMKGFHTLIMHSFGAADGSQAKDLPLIRETDVSRHPTTGDHKQTIIASAVYNDHNAWVNGGNLLKRLHQLDQLYESEKRGEHLTKPQFEAAAQLDMSPAALQLSKLILSLIVEEPERVRMEPDAPSLIGSAAEPLHLRPDAAHILQHVKLAGYSKGGNIVTDAVRHLILQLQHEGAVLAPTALNVAPVPAAQPYIPVSNPIITSLIRNVGILAVNPGICPLTDREKDLGMRRISIRNNLDRISAHLFRKHDREQRFGTHDAVYVVNGKSMGDLGHGIDAALGTRSKPGYLIDPSKASPEDAQTLQLVRSRLQAFFASCYNKVGISHITYDEADPTTLGIEFSNGVSETLIGKDAEQIIDSMEQAGLQNVRMSCDLKGAHQCRMQFDAPEGCDIRQTIAAGLRHLQNTHADIFLSHTLFYELGVMPDPSRSQSPTPTIEAQGAVHEAKTGNTTRSIG